MKKNNKRTKRAKEKAKQNRIYRNGVKKPNSGKWLAPLALMIPMISQWCNT